MEPASVLALAGLVFAAAALYASVGHGGASGYLAAMALIGVAPEAMRPAALALNVLVAGIGTVAFVRAGRLMSWGRLRPRERPRRAVPSGGPCQWRGGCPGRWRTRARVSTACDRTG